ncbi:MAG: S-layer homology domain-containing protein [Anaerovoracaceae bacterium]
MKQEYIRRAAARGWQGTDVRGTAMSAGAEIGRNSRSAGRALAMVMAFMMAVSLPFGPLGAKSAYAEEDPKTFTIHYKLAYGDVNYISGQQPADRSGVHLDELVTMPNLGTSYTVQTGYVFSGWTLDPSAMVSDDDPVYHGGRNESFGYDIVGENDEITLYAVVKPLQLKITLAVNHTGYQGSWSADAGTFAYGSQVTLPAMNYSLSCDCSEFLGWSLKTNGTSEDVLFRKAGDAVSASAIYGKLTSPVIRDGIVDVKLYDTWAGNSYRINFVPAAPEAGEGAPACTISMPAISGSSQGVLIPAGGMEYSGYTLTGWTTATGGALVYTADGKAKITGAAAAEIFAAQGGAPGAPADRTIYLYPVWTPKYTITLIAATKDEAAGDGSYILNSTTGGVVSSKTGSEVTVTDGQAVPGSLGITAKPQHGYAFTGWRTVTGGALSGSDISAEEDLTDLVYDSGEFGKFLTLAACFEKKDYTFTLNASAHSRIELLKNNSEFPPASSGAAVSSPAGVTAENGQERGIDYRLGDALAIRITELSPSDYPLVHVILKYGEDRASQTAATLSLETLKQYAKAETEGGYNCYTLKLEELIRAAGQNVKEYWTEEGLTGTWLLTAECSETKVLPRFTVTGEVGAGSGHGSVSPSYKDAVSGESVSVTVTPDSGYYISKLTVTSGGSTADKTPSGYASSAVVLSCTAETKVYAEFSAVPQLYHVTKAGTSNGSFSLSHSGEVASGTRVTVYADPDSGYRVKAVYVNGVFRSYSDSYSFTVTEDSEVYVVFERGGTRYTITGIETDHGTLSIDEEVVEKGDDLTVKIRPDSGYKISRLYVDGSSVTVTSSYTFTNIRKDHTIRAVFAKGSSEYTIRGTAGTGGTVSIGTKTVDAGDDLTVTISAYSGYRISDVLVDGKSVGTVSKYTFEDIDDDHTIQAVFTEANFVNSGQYGMVNDGGITMTPSTFADVNAGDWYYQAMKFVTERGMMNRTSNNTMSPNVNASRADIVYMLYQYDGAPSASTSSRFYDVYSTSWYARSVNWASNYGIAAGISGTQFNPNGSVTREQLAAIMYRYAQYKGGNVTNTGDYSIRTFSDRNSISPYAKDAVCWACNSGLLSGKTGTRLDPKGSATRAEAATIIMRFCNSL